MEPKSNFTSVASHHKSSGSKSGNLRNELEGKFQYSVDQLIISPLLEHGKETSKSVANCIRGLNATIDALSKENLVLRKGANMETIEGKGKKIQEINERLMAQLKEQKEKNLDLKEKYERVKEMYDILADKQKQFEKFNFSISNDADFNAVKQNNKKLIDTNHKYLIEIENLKSKLELSHQTIVELKNTQKAFSRQNEKSEKFVNEMAEINSQLLRFIKSNKNRSSSKLQTEESTQSSVILKFEKSIRKLNHKYEEIKQKELEKSHTSPIEIPVQKSLKSSGIGRHKIKNPNLLMNLREF